MGCDIHMHLEYHRSHGEMEPVVANTFFITRDYDLFAALAGVRNRNAKPIKYSPRGLPADVSNEIFLQFFIEIIPDNADDWKKNLGHEWCFESDAKRYVQEHNSVIERFNDHHQYVSNPDWHTASYLSLTEINLACEAAGYNLGSAPPEFQLVIDFMEATDRRFGENASRIVFWFDN